jgi:hypothetical protein
VDEYIGLSDWANNIHLLRLSQEKALCCNYCAKNIKLGSARYFSSERKIHNWESAQRIRLLQLTF